LVSASSGTDRTIHGDSLTRWRWCRTRAYYDPLQRPPGGGQLATGLLPPRRPPDIHYAGSRAPARIAARRRPHHQAHLPPTTSPAFSTSGLPGGATPGRSSRKVVPLEIHSLAELQPVRRRCPRLGTGDGTATCCGWAIQCADVGWDDAGRYGCLNRTTNDGTANPAGINAHTTRWRGGRRYSRQKWQPRTASQACSGQGPSPGRQTHSEVWRIAGHRGGGPCAGRVRRGG
jgi:hypothetical protein